MSTSIIQISAAREALTKAKSLRDVLDIKDKAAAIKTLYASMGESFFVQNQAAELKLRAERKAGAMLAEMENAKTGPKQLDDTLSSNSLASLGITPKQSSRWQAEAKVSEEEFDSWVDESNSEEKEITQAALLKFARGPHVGNNSCDNEWYTPAEFIEPFRVLVGQIDIDPASSKEANAVVKAKKIFTIDDNGLHKKWIGNVWMNPPYASGAVEPFAAKLLLEIEEGRTRSAAVLLNNATETKWFQMLLGCCNAACFIGSRVKFWKPNVKTMTPLQGQVLLYFGESGERFAELYDDIGRTLFAATKPEPTT